MSDSVVSLKAFLADRRAEYVTSVRVIAETKSAILDVSRERVGDTATRRMTSKRQLARLASDIKKAFGLSVLFAFRSEGPLAAIEAGLRATLERRFPGAASELVVSFPTQDRAEVLFRRSGQSEAGSGADLKAVIVEFLREAKFDAVHIEEMSAELPQPSQMNILKALKSCAPATVDQLVVYLNEHGFSLPSTRWLSSKLDSARKRDWVVRSNDGRFALTIEGLGVVPASRRRTSSDIERILALGRRKQW